MQIEKNIAAMLQSKMEETGKTKLEFSKELGIPRSTLQGYLKGDTSVCALIRSRRSQNAWISHRHS